MSACAHAPESDSDAMPTNVDGRHSAAAQPFGSRARRCEVIAVGAEQGRVEVDPFGALLVAHWASLVRLAALLVRDADHEDVVQEAAISCLRGSHRLRDDDAALAYLRRAVVNTARSALRRRRVALAHRPAGAPNAPGADEAAIAALERDAVVVALRSLPRRQREALVLRYYADLSEKQAAQAMKVSVGAVKSYTSRGLVALRVALGDQP